jgi:hypothetical protein
MSSGAEEFDLVDNERERKEFDGVKKIACVI